LLSVDKRALLSLDISNNSIVAEKQVKEADCQGASFNVGDLVLYQGEECPVSYTWNDGDIRIMHLSGIEALADGIKNNGSLIKLDISSNYIGAEQERGLQRICVASGIDLAK
jgi:hypothetical protein